MNKSMIVVAATIILLASAGATVVTSIPGGTVTPMPAINYFGPGPETFGPGIVWSSTNVSNQGGSVYGYNSGYGFVSNGFWDNSLIMAGINDSVATYGVADTMTFTLPTTVTAVGGFLNYAPGYGTPTIAVYDASHTLIESYVLTFLTGGGTDTGAFYGFQETTPIKYFTLTDSYIAITNLTTGSSAAPEPSSLLMLGSGVLGLLGVVRRKMM